MTQAVAVDEVRLPGRPPIGPKVQCAAPEDVFSDLQREALRRGVRLSVVVREVVVAGHALRFGPVNQ